MPYSLPCVLVPFDRAEALTIAEAARLAGKSMPTVRGWASAYSLGRRVGGGTWLVSAPALLMWLDGDEDTLRAYLAGDRDGDAVRNYFARAAREKEKR